MSKVKVRSGIRPIDGKWEPIETAPLNTSIIVTDGKTIHLATFVKNLVFAEPPKPAQNYGLGQANVLQSKSFCPTHWYLTPKIQGQP